VTDFSTAKGDERVCCAPTLNGTIDNATASHEVLIKKKDSILPN
jgi:hypothetical protein